MMKELRLKDPKRLQEVGAILKDLLKVIKVVSLYPAGNPLPTSLRQSFGEKLVDLVDQLGGLTVTVQKQHLLCAGETVYSDTSKEDALAELLFTAGITTLKFSEGLSVEEVYNFLDVAKQFVNTPGKDADLVSMLWEGELSHISVSTVDDVTLAAYDGTVPADSLSKSITREKSGVDKEQLGAIFRHAAKRRDKQEADGAEGGEAEFDDTEEDDVDDKLEIISDGKYIENVEEFSKTPLPKIKPKTPLIPQKALNVASKKTGLDFEAFFPPSAVLKTPGSQAKKEDAKGAPHVSPSPAEFRTALVLNDGVKLSEEEENHMKGLVSKDESFDMYESTLELCKELLHQEPIFTDFVETVGLCEKVVTEFMQHGRLGDVVDILKYIEQLEKQVQKERPQWSERLKQARNMAASREQMKILAESLNSHPDISADTLRTYLNLFGQESLLGMGELIGQLRISEHHKCLIDHMTKMGPQHVNVIGKGVHDKKPETVRMAVGVLCKIGGPVAFSYIQKAMRHDDRHVRLDIVAHLKDNMENAAVDVLKVMVFDRDNEVKRKAIANLSSRTSKVAYNAVSDIVNDNRIVELDANEQQAILNAYSRLGGEEAVELLKFYANKLNPFNEKSVEEQRNAAFRALACNESDSAEQLLLQLSKSWRPDLRNLAKETIRQRRELKFGGDHGR